MGDPLSANSFIVSMALAKQSVSAKRYSQDDRLILR